MTKHRAMMQTKIFVRFSLSFGLPPLVAIKAHFFYIMENATIEKVTPELAEKLLASNSSNRRVSKELVDFLAREITEGRWVVNGDTIRTSKDGTLLDGQHRLLAVIKSGVTIDSYMVKGLNQSCFSTIDTGKQRNPSDVLSINGFKNSHNYAALGKAILLYNSGVRSLNTKIGTNSSGGVNSSSRRKFSNQEILDFCLQNDLSQYLVFADNCYRKSKILSATEYALLYYFFSAINSAEADDFFEKLSSGAGLLLGDPILTLRNKMIENLSTNLKFSGRTRLLLLIKTWNYVRSGQQIKLLKWAIDEAIPTPI